jgi:hypothetical protein
MKWILPVVAVLAFSILACSQTTPTPEVVSRRDSVPSGAVKQTPADDPWPPVAAAGWSQPVPLDGPINTAGAEDSPFVPEDGGAFYFFFTPDLNIPVENQVGDGVTGIWMAPRLGDGWGEPVRVRLAGPGELSLDGCEFVLGDEMWFCSIRAGNTREIDIYTARFVDEGWTDWQNAGEQVNLDYQVGEMHITADGQELYFGSTRPGGFGGLDLWVSQRAGDGWGEPVNLGAAINGPGNENRPFVTADGRELWFDAESRSGHPGPAIFRSVRQPDDSWGPAEEIISQFAGEPNLAADGNTLYFVHHFFSADLGSAIEADIYVSFRIP